MLNPDFPGIGTATPGQGLFMNTLPIIGQFLNVLPNYQIRFDPEPYVILKLGVGLDQRQLAFRHENLLALRYTVHHFKHYRTGGSKFWTRKGGADFYMAVPKIKIQIVPEHGYSYPKIVIGGEILSLNVSGGGGATWTDWISRIAETRVNEPWRVFTVVADHALPVAECRQAGVTLDLPPLDDPDRRFLENAMARRNLKAVTPGMQVTLAAGFNTAGGNVLTLEARRPQSFLCRNGSPLRIKVTFPQVDWVATCQANGIARLPLDAFNHVPAQPPEVADGQPAAVRS